MATPDSDRGATRPDANYHPGSGSRDAPGWVVTEERRGTGGGPDTATLSEPAPVEELETGASMWALVFAGGIGSRFWPLSTPERPKQLLALLNDRPLIADTVQRLEPLVPAERVLVLTSRDIAPAIRGAIPEVPDRNILVEPRPLGTAAALAWGAQEVRRRGGPKALFCAMHADLAVSFPDSFRAALQTGGGVASRYHAIVTIGAHPTRVDTGFGYVVPGTQVDLNAPLTAGAPRWATRFVEKPDEQQAESLLSDGALWHTGIIVCEAATVLNAMHAHTRELEPGLDALSRGDTQAFADAIARVSIERGLLERNGGSIVIPAEFGWDDVGTWASLRRARDLDDQGNGVLGPVFFADASANVVHAEAGPVVLYGVSQLLVVSLGGLTFVTTLDRAKDLRPLLETLPAHMRLRPNQGE